MQSREWVLVAMLLAAAALPRTFAARDSELKLFAKTDLTFDRSKVNVFQGKVLSFIFPQSISGDKAWTELAMRLMEGIMPDFDFHDANSNTVPPALVDGFQDATSHYCGRVSRLWIRLPFHDCGTYNRKKRTGGCNGSLRLEIPSGEFVAFKTGPVQTPFPNATSFPFPFNRNHAENNGFAPSIAFFENARQGLSDKSGKPISWADTEVLGGILALWACGGEFVQFVPGRYDAQGPDGEGLLPSPLDTPQRILKSFHRMGLNQLDTVTLAAGSHTTAAFMRGRMDKTPSQFDNQWAIEAIDIARNKQSSLICDMTNPVDFVLARTLAKPQCAMQFVVDFGKLHPTGAHMESFAKSNQKFTTQFAASFAKMVNQLSPDLKPASLSDDFDGFQGDDQDTEEERKNTKQGWANFQRRR